MYKLFKTIFISLIPKTTVRKFEPLFRKLLSIFYTGKSAYCKVCKSRFSKFIALDNKLICPKCASLGRHRRLIDLIDESIKDNPDFKILDISPPIIMSRILKERFDSKYITSNIDHNVKADFSYDLKKIDTEVKYSLIICYHVLEHIEDDTAAMNELYRITKNGGKLLVQTPFKIGEIYEDPDIITPYGRKEHFGQDDHVRIYSPNGLKKRLESCGFNVKITEFKESQDDNYFGLEMNEIVLEAVK